MKVTRKKASVNEFEKGIVTFLDVLGWKGLWQRKDVRQTFSIQTRELSP